MQTLPTLRLFLAVFAVVSLVALTMSRSSDVQAGNAAATFTPNPLSILEGGSANLNVSIQKDLTQDEAATGKINVDLILPGTLSDTVLGSASVPIPGANPVEGQSVSVAAKFSLSCADGKIVGASETIDSPAELEVEFPDPSPDESASGVGTVECLGIAIVAFDPVPLLLEEGEEDKVSVTFTKHLSQTEAFDREVIVRLMHKGTDTLLGTKTVKFGGQPFKGQRVKRTTSFLLECDDNEIKGLNSTGLSGADLSVQFTVDGEEAGEGRAECIQRTSSTFPSTGSHPSDVVIDPATGYAYVLNAFDGAVGVFDGTQLLGTIQLPCPEQPAAAGGQPGAEGFNCIYQGLASLQSGFFMGPDLQLGLAILFFSLFSSNPATQGSDPPEPIAIPVGDSPLGLAQDPVSGNVYVANSQDGTVSVIDPVAAEVIDTINVGGIPQQVAADGSAGIVYVTNFTGDSVDVIDTSTNTVIDTIDVGDGADGVAVHPQTGDLYVTNFVDDTLSIVSNPGGAAAFSAGPVVQTVNVGDGPIDVDVNPLTNRVFVVNANDDTLSVVNPLTLEVTATLPTGITPDGVATHPDKGLVYVVNHLVNTVIVYSDTSPYDDRLWGDIDCSGEVDAGDALPILEWAGELVPGSASGCPGLGQPVSVFGYPGQEWGDLNCDGVIDTFDAIDAILVAAGLPDSPVADCPLVGSPVLVN